MRNRQKRDEMRDRAVGIASCESALKGDGNEREMVARVAKSTESLLVVVPTRRQRTWTNPKSGQVRRAVTV